MIKYFNHLREPQNTMNERSLLMLLLDFALDLGLDLADEATLPHAARSSKSAVVAAEKPSARIMPGPRLSPGRA